MKPVNPTQPGDHSTPAVNEKTTAAKRKTFNLGEAERFMKGMNQEELNMFTDTDVPLSAAPVSGNGIWGRSGIIKKITDCIIHWIILLCSLLLILYTFLRRRYIKSSDRIEASLIFDRIVLLLPIPLSIAFYFLISCILDVAAIFVLLFVSVICSEIIRRTYRKQQDNFYENEAIKSRE